MGRIAYNLATVAAFFAVFKFFGIYAATIVVMTSVAAEVLWTAIRHKRVSRLQWIGLFLVIALGGATLIFRNEIFIKWRPTGVYWLIALAFLFSLLALGKNPVRLIIGRWVTLPDARWARLAWSWVGILTALGFANLAVAYQLSTEVWVNWRVFGAPGLILVIIVAQCAWLREHVSAGMKAYFAENRTNGKESEYLNTQ